MSWIIFAIAAHFFWAWGSVADKYIVGKRVKNPYVYQVWLAILSLIYVVLIPFVSFTIPHTKDFLLLLLAAALYLFGSFPYIKAMQMEEVTRVNIWWNLIPIISLFLGWLFIGEVLTVSQMIAFGFLLFGGILASIKINNSRIRFSKSFFLMVLACLFYASYGVILRYLGEYINPISSFIWLNLLMIVYLPFLFINKKFKQDFFLEIKEKQKSFLVILLIILFIGDAALLSNILALSTGPVALVFAMEGWQIIFVFFITIIISLFHPKVLNEDLSKKNIIVKVLSLIIIIIGILLMNIF